MSYDVQLFRRETMEKEKISNSEDFFENENNLVPFTHEQKEKLHKRLLKYDYQVINNKPDMTRYEHSDISGISILLTNNALYFSSSGEGIFEISMTASEFTDDNNFAKYDPQNGGWEEF